MLGNGRPFLLEILNPKKVGTESELDAAANAINNAEPKLVGVTTLRQVGSEATAIMRDGETDKQARLPAVLDPRAMLTSHWSFFPAFPEGVSCHRLAVESSYSRRFEQTKGFEKLGMVSLSRTNNGSI